LQRKLRRGRPSNLSKDFTERLCIEAFEQALKTRAQGDEFCGRASRHFEDFIERKTDRRNHLRRFCEVLWAVESCGGARKLLRSTEKF
jgi:hypothetical protein